MQARHCAGPRGEPGPDTGPGCEDLHGSPFKSIDPFRLSLAGSQQIFQEDLPAPGKAGGTAEGSHC